MKLYFPLLALLLGCAHGSDAAKPPGTASAPATTTGASPLAATPAPAASPASPASPTPAASPAPAASPTPAASPSPAPTGTAPTAAETPGHLDETNVYARDRGAAAREVPLFDASGHPLPQTSERPSTKTPSFEARLFLIEQAIRYGKIDEALPAFFPVAAYAQVKDIPEPEKDWEHRLASAFRRDLLEFRKQLGPGVAEKSILIDVSVPEAQAKLMKPGSEGNRVAYYRVLHAKLTFRLENGKERTLGVTSMISWRGEWYVVHLHGFK